MASQPVPCIPVPLLDVNRQNAPLQVEIQAALAQVCASGSFVHGPACQQFEDAMAHYCGVSHAVGCASGSDALLLALMTLGIGPGDEVVLPSFTFFATASAVTRLGATPVFADILPSTFNIDPGDVARKISSRTKAILPVHLFGQCADMKALQEIAIDAGNLPVIEDAAQAIGAEFDGRRAGSMGTMGCFSFYPTKNLGGIGDGGMITTNDELLASQLRILRDHGQHPRYHHAQVGLNSRLDSLQAAALNVKLKRLDDWTNGRRRNAERYESEFLQSGLNACVALPTVAPACTSVWNQFTVRIRNGQRDAVQQHLAAQQIGSAVYYPIPLHLQECFSFLGYKQGSLPVTEQACLEVLSLPIYGELTLEEQNQVITALAGFFGISAATTEQCAA
ncbi:DegT/DnrJ/EryC1/StrS family aminotransferase [Bythopirellula polymerisocia]|uniref:Aminotransferase n=1 Tax=Bythopirellula polymerisocia TaxID=2528003 RepID=A0A5C6D4D9_9BACT|nr:DegT/DnrJ/EryC1/StrS family aminotransferase [Bythopirellula polymerisocia]TWU30116.1 Aminotransferase [Bythopirellula polymerisocia]